MPVLEQNGSGSVNISSAITNFVQTVEPTGAAATGNTRELYVNQLPRLVFHITQTAGATAATFTPQFSVRSTTGGGGEPAQNFLPLSGGVVLPALNIPLVLEFEMPCDFIRGEILTSAVSTSVTVILAAYAS